MVVQDVWHGYARSIEVDGGARWEERSGLDPSGGGVRE